MHQGARALGVSGMVPMETSQGGQKVKEVEERMEIEGGGASMD